MDNFSKILMQVAAYQADMIAVCEVIYQEDYKIWVKFNTGESGVVDLYEVIQRYKVAQPLLDTNEFRKFYLDEWPTLAWSCGFDVAPESLYERVTGKRPERQQIETLHEGMEEYK
jgi:hypothetical protein